LIKQLHIFFTVLLFYCFSFTSYSQTVEISSTAYSILSGFTLYYQIQDRNAFKYSGPLERQYSETWHTLQTLEALSLINVGYQIGDNNKNFAGVTTDVFLTGAIRWIVRDGTYQLLLGNSFFNLSNETTAQFEKFGTPVVKISFLVVILIFKYFILPEL
jgi:hypothetical protein